MTTWSAEDHERDCVAGQPAFLFFALFLLLQVTVATFLQLASVPFGLVFSEVFLFAAPVVLWSLATNHRHVRFLKLGKASMRMLAVGGAVGAANFLLAGSIQALSRSVLPSLAKNADPLRLFRDASSLELAAVVVAVGLFAPVCEELAFRGYLQTVLGARLGRVVSVVVTALLFSLLHLDPAGLLARVELGVLFGLLVLWSGSLWPAIAAHAANNLIASSIMIAALGRQESSGSGGGTSEAILFGVASLAATAALLFVFRALARRDSPETSDDPVEVAEGESHLFVAARAKRPAAVAGIVAAVSLAVFFAFCWRHAVLNYADALVPASSIEKQLVDESLREPLRQRLKQVRALARGGEVEPARYRRLREALAAAGGKDEPRLDAQAIEAAFSVLETAPPQ